jgi:hypothetical protein
MIKASALTGAFSFFLYNIYGCEKGYYEYYLNGCFIVDFFVSLYWSEKTITEVKLWAIYS